MRGTERRREDRGRRASDSPGLWGRPYERALFLSILLILAMAILLVAREQSRPHRELDQARHSLLVLEARLYADAVERQAQDLKRVMDAADTLLDASPASALTALEQAAQTNGGTALLLANDHGQPLAAHGEGASLQTGVTVVNGRLNISRPRHNGGVLAGSQPVVTPHPFQSDIRLDIRPARQLPASLFATDAPILLPDPQGRDRLTQAVRIGETGLAIMADRPARSAFLRWSEDARVLAVPLVLGVLLLALLAVQTMKQDRRAKNWAETERRFRIAVEAAQCGIWQWDIARGHLTLSDYMARLLSVPEGTTLGTQAMVERVHPRFRDTFVAAMTKARVEGEFELSFPLAMADGGVRWLDVRGRAQETTRMGEHRRLMGIALDVTEARRAKARAQAAEDRLIDGIQSVSEAFVLFDRKGDLVLWNQAFQEAFGFRAEALYRGASKAELNRIAAMAVRSETRPDPRRAGMREVELLDGRWLQMTERQTGDGGTVVIASDITVIRNQEHERRMAAEKLQRTIDELEANRSRLTILAQQYQAALERAEAANQSKSEFLANMSHELRTPLNAINGFSEIMAKEMFGPLGDRRYLSYANDIHNSGRHLLSLINDILDMAKIEAGKLTLYYERTDLGALGRDVIRLMRGRAEEAGLALALDAPDTLVAEVDYRGMKQVLLNLVSNAIKFTPRAGRVTLEMIPLIERPHMVRISVRDTGIGIAPEDLDRLAQPFVQVENQHAKTTQGTGLGLALTKSLIEMHDAEMVIDSEPGRGTIVWFDLPMKATRDDKAYRIDNRRLTSQIA